jgi:menaquinone-specific isochorismate synthase
MEIEEFLRTGALFSLPGGSLCAAWGDPKRAAEPQNNGLPAFYLPDFFLNDKAPWWHFPHFEEVSPAVLTAELQALRLPCPTPVSWTAPNFQQFVNAYDTLSSAFNAGTLQKAVPYLFTHTTMPLTRDRLAAMLLSVMRKTEGFPLYLYGFWNGDEGMLGATPEILFRRNGNDGHHIETVACAGTLPIDGDPKAFMNDPKECAEHHWVVDGILEALKKLGLNATVETMKVVTLPTLVHLVTPIYASFTNGVPPTFEQLVKALHPTPAVGAIPSPTGTEWLQAYDRQLPRYRFAAPVGLLLGDRQDVHSLVAIRNVQWKNNRIAIAAGCGIIAASQCEREWREIMLKIESIKQLLGFA